MERARAAGVSRRAVSFVVDSAEPMLWGGELILRDGIACGQVCSAAWGESTGACVGLAYVRGDFRSGSYEVNVGGVRHPIMLSLKGIYDPGNQRIRG